jgi:hypothetical protein
MDESESVWRRKAAQAALSAAVGSIPVEISPTTIDSAAGGRFGAGARLRHDRLLVLRGPLGQETACAEAGCPIRPLG